VAVIIAFAPIFLANMVFAQRFRDIGDSTTAFGANLLGAIIGGVLEYSSLVIGYRWLLVLVALLYALAFITARSHLRSPAPAPPPPKGIGVPLVPFLGTLCATDPLVRDPLERGGRVLSGVGDILCACHESLPSTSSG
jgi:hypothetical protein